jgi:hypothetical protein
MNTSAVPPADRTPGGVCPAMAHAGPPTARSTPTHPHRGGPYPATVAATGDLTAAAPHRTDDLLTGKTRSAAACTRVVARRPDGTNDACTCLSGAGRHRPVWPDCGAPAEVRAEHRRFPPRSEAQA